MMPQRFRWPAGGLLLVGFVAGGGLAVRSRNARDVPNAPGFSAVTNVREASRARTTATSESVRSRTEPDPSGNRGAAATSVASVGDADVRVGTLRATHRAGALRVATATSAFAIRAVGLGRGAARADFAPGSDHRDDRRIEEDLGEGVVAFVTETPAGLEHGFSVAAPPDGTGALVLELALEGAHVVRAAPRELVIRPAGSTIEIAYAALAVVDASGRSIDVRFDVEGTIVRVVVDDAGARYPIIVDPLLYELEQKLLASDRASSDSFASSMDFLADGTLLLVGASGESDATTTNTSGNGAIYVFERASDRLEFVQTGKLLAADKASGDAFGSDLDLSADGSRLAVGAQGNSTAGPPAAVVNGAAYVFVRTGSTFTVEQKLLATGYASNDYFGSSVALSDDASWLAVGAERDDEAAAPSTTDSGAVYLFERVGTVWTERQKIMAPIRTGLGLFGSDVAFSADGSRLVVACPRDDEATAPATTQSGAVYVYERNAGSYAFVQKVVASDRASFDEFGFAIALSADGARLVVGSHQEDDPTGVSTSNNGAAYVFSWDGSAFQEQAKLLASDKTSGDTFGDSVALSADGDVLAVGARNADDEDLSMTTRSGAVYAFRWSGAAYVEAQKIIASDAANDDQNGWTLALDATGTFLASGTLVEDDTARGLTSNGAAYAYALDKGATFCAGDGECASGFCVEGVCCDSACGGGAPDDCISCRYAQTGRIEGRCAPLDVVAPTVVCRASAGACDAEERCTVGVASCPSDLKYGAETLCRASAGPCDPEERCDGSADVCGADARADASTVCRGSAGACDAEERCDGIAAACPGDTRVAAGVVCRASTGTCDPAEMCDGTGIACPSDALATTAVVCRPSAGACDPEERCDGAGAACPSDTRADGTVLCRASAGGCDVPEFCDGTAPTCGADVRAPSGFECRAVKGACDVAERCDGTSAACPLDVREPSGFVCRPSSGACDVPEVCDGGTDGCPADAFVSASVVCRSAAPGAACDVAERCPGDGAACPADGVAPSGTTCRPSAGACDVSETCDGLSSSCPADVLADATVTCRASAGACDLPELCSGTSAQCPSNRRAGPQVVCRASSGGCDVEERCNGIDLTCPTDGLASPGVVCRASAGACDVDESCDGTSPTCPVDATLAAGVACRPATGACDVAEVCDGSSATCPPDAFVPSGTTCRASGAACELDASCTGTAAQCPPTSPAPAGTTCRPAADVCDAEERCNGSDTACPFDRLQLAGTPCRPALPTATCDVAETCTGTSVSCPADAFLPLGTECRASLGVCDLAELCSGRTGSCPSDQVLPGGTVCDDGLTCTAASACQAGLCVGSVTLDCSDGSACTIDGCAEPSGCFHQPIPACGLDAAVDSGGMDVGLDASTAPADAGGCSCRIAPLRERRGAKGFAALAFVLAISVRARRRAR